MANWDKYSQGSRPSSGERPALGPRSSGERPALRPRSSGERPALRPAKSPVLTRLVFIGVAALLVGAGLWAYHHDQKLGENASQVTIGDPNEVVRQLLGDPSSEGPCGALTPVPSGCVSEYIYRYWYSVFQPKYEVIWFDHAGKVLGEQQVKSTF